MIGQKNLLAKLNNYELADLPKTILFIGELGSGKKTIIKMLSDKFDLDIIEIKANFEPEQLIEYQQRPLKTIYQIELSAFTQKQQNQLLKFIEEPPDNAYIMLTAETELLVLPTILSRCMRFYMEPYTKEELRKAHIYQNDLIYNICRTPGQLFDVNTKHVEAIADLAEKLITCLSKASFSNTLSIETKINYKEEYNKFDFNLFLNTVEYIAFKNYLTTKNDIAYKLYTITNKYKQELVDKQLLKENFIINYLSAIWANINC